MWSLPDINRLNEEAAANAARNIVPETEPCLECDETETSGYEYYDPFSDDPKGFVYLCDEHYGYSGNPCEGYFYCDECNRVFIENYTWENYYTTTEHGEIFCINCAFDKYIEDDENWLTDPETITFEYIRSRPHVIPNSGTHHEKKLIFIGNAEFDSYSGEGISGGGIEGLKEIARKAITQASTRDLFVDLLKENKEEAPRFIIILDTTWQFASSFGVYIDRKFGGE